MKSGLKLQRTGMLVIETKPAGASIFLNGKEQKTFFKSIFLKETSALKTPAKIKNITPGEYEIRAEKENYWPWQKKLKIARGETVFAENIELFRRTVPILILASENGSVSLTSDKKLAVMAGEKAVVLTDANGNIIGGYQQTSSSTAATKGKIEWSPRNKKILVGRFVFDVNDFDKPTDLTAETAPGANNFKWSENDDNLIYYASGKTVHAFNLATKKDESVVSEFQFFDYLPKYGKINLVVSHDAQINPKTATGTEISLIKMPPSGYSFVNRGDDLINLIDVNNDMMYLVDPFSPIKIIKSEISGVTTAVWVSGSKLLCANDHEVWLYNSGSGNKTLLTRVSDKINTVIWHPSDNYVIFVTNKNINVLELDDREKYNITKILEFGSIKQAFLNESGNTLYFYGSIGNQEGFYKLAV